MEPVATSAHQIAPASSLNLSFLEGLRGLAALYVVCHHAWFEVVYKETINLPPAIFYATRFLRFGQHAVDLFIVLSGFCLMLPLIRHGQLDGGVRRFIGRRVRRIFPPYYAALGLSMLAIQVVPILHTGSGDRWDFALLELSPGTILSHLLLLHNLSGPWMYGINPPMWSVATEWQIYFFFALISVPIFRRWGGVAAALFTMAAGLYFSMVVTAFNYACPWFLTLFGFGMFAAHVATSASMRHLRETINFRLISGLALSGYLLVALALPSLLSNICLSVDLIVGAVAATALVDATLRQGESAIGRLASTRPALWLGRCSYSLYLTHVPLLALFHLTMRKWGIGTFPRLMIMLLVIVPIVVLAAAGFAAIFERPFLKRANPTKSVGGLAEHRPTALLRAA